LAVPEGNRCNPTGAWTGAFEYAPGMYWYFTFTVSPEDPDTKRSVGILKWLNDDPTLGGSFPADYRSDFVMERIRTGKNTWKVTAVGYGVNKGTGELVYIMTYSEIQKYTNNCNTAIVDDGKWALYLPFQDVNPIDGFPDDDQIQSPIVSETFSAEANRLPMID